MDNSETSARLECGQINTVLRTMNPIDYPAPPQLASGETWSAAQRDFKASIKCIDFAISTDETRPAMTGMLLIINSDNTRVIAMDGFRFAEKTISIPSNIQHECIIPNKAVRELARLLADDDEPFEAQVSSNHLIVRFDRILFQCRLIEAPFPFKSAQELIRREADTRVVVSRKTLMNIIERALLITREDAKGTNIIRFILEGNNLTISSNSPDLGRITEELSVDTNGENLVIGFNGRYMLDALGAIEDDKVVFLFSGALTAAVIRAERRNDFTCILSPVRLATQ
jgi:DNA polymerase-3 subunit beta